MNPATVDLGSFFDLTGDFLCVTDAMGRFLRVNRAFSQSTGYSEVEFLAGAAGSLKIPLGAGEAIEKFVCKTGETKWLSWTTSQRGPLVYAVAREVETSRESDKGFVGETKRLVEQKEESDRKFRETFEHAGIGIAHADLETRIGAVNQELCKLLGYSEQELLGTKVTSLMADDDVATPESLRESFLRGRTDRVVRERRLRRKDGSKIWLLITATAVRETDGSARYIILAAKDITKNKEVEFLLQQSEMSFRVVAETIPQIVWTADADGEIEYFNERWFKFTGLSSSAPWRTLWMSALHPDDAEDCFRQWKRSATTGEPYENQRRFRRASDGQYRWHLARALPVRDAEGRILKWFGTCTDIHDEKVGEEARRLAAIGEKVAQENERIKTEFLATFSHEIRTPLNSVIGMSEMLMDSSLDSDQYEYADTIKGSAEVLLALINDVLDLSKIEAGRLALEKINFGLRKTVRDVELELAWKAREKGVELKVAIDPDVPDWILGDAMRTRQIVSNLLSNAVKFTHRGSVDLTVRVVEHGQSLVKLEFVVRDTGIGIAAEKLESLFQPFTQVDSSMTRRYGGTGLGLSICKKLVSLMRGELSVTSVLGEGSVFRFALPFEIGTQTEVVSTPMAPPKRWIRPPRILVAEDLAVNHRVLSLFLKKAGCEFSIAENGVEALDLIDRQTFDLVLMDCQMPVLDGYETARAIRARPNSRHAQVPIVATTANAVSGDVERCLAAGMNGYLAKPIRLQQLNEVLFHALQHLDADSDQPEEVETVAPNHSFDVSIDWTVLNEVERQDEGRSILALDLIRLFSANVSERFGDLQAAVMARDAGRSDRCAHALKSASCYIGAVRLQILCDRLRSRVATPDFESASYLLAEIDKEIKIVLAALAERFPQNVS